MYVANEFVTYSPARSSLTCLSFVRSNALHPAKILRLSPQGPSPSPSSIQEFINQLPHAWDFSTNAKAAFLMILFLMPSYM
jgi:hypothetical protein